MIRRELMNKVILLPKILILAFLLLLSGTNLYSQSIPYPVVDTDVTEFYNSSEIISQPEAGSPFYGQDAQYAGNQASYTDNKDGTITDNNTGLIWQKEMGEKISYADAFHKAAPALG